MKNILTMAHFSFFKHPVPLFFFIGMLFVLFGLVLHVTGFTVLPVDQLYCRNLLPWSSLDFTRNCSVYRSGDDILENDVSAREINYLLQNPYQNTYSERIMNGVPVRDAYASTPYAPYKLLTRILPNPTAANVVGLFYLF